MGIGTNTPTEALEVNSPDTTEIRISASSINFGPTRLAFISDKSRTTEWRPAFIQSGDNGSFTGRLDFITNGTGIANTFGRRTAMSVVNGRVGIGTITPTETLEVLGNVKATTFITASDRRLKTDIAALRESLPKFTQLNGYHFKWINEALGKDLQTGLIAQEVAQLFPELVSQDDKGFLAVNYIGLVPHLIEAVKELTARQEREATYRQRLESRLERLEAMSTTQNDSHKTEKK